MKVLLLSIFINLFSAISFCQDSVSVLFIGNSYTSVNDLPLTLSNLTTSKGDKIFYNSHTPGGATFQIQSSNAQVYQKIKSNPWDFVVLQGQSQEPSFPFEQVNSNTIPYAIQLADSVYANNSCSQALFYMTWGRQNGDQQWDSINTFDKMNNRLYDAYMRIADSVRGSISPVAVAWKYIRDNHPTINLYQSDGSHPSVEGTYLAACVFYASIFRKSPVGASFTYNLPQQTVTILQNTAESIVLNNVNTYNLHPINDLIEADFNYTVNQNEVNFENVSFHSNEYVWNFGDNTTSNETNPIHVFNQNGTFTIQLISSANCGADTIVKEITISSLSSKDLKNENGFNYKITDNKLQIQFNDKEFTIIQLTNLSGKILNEQKGIENEFFIPLNQGVMNIIQIKRKNKNSLLKIIN